MIACILPSRGLVFTQLEDRIEEFRKDFDLIVYRSWNLPIPECLNVLVDYALKNTEVTHLLFLEEDTIPPKDALSTLIHEKKDISIIEYPLKNMHSSLARNGKGDIVFAGFGCTLIHRRVFEALERPFFRSDMAYEYPANEWKQRSGESYGLHDVYFFHMVRKAGFTLHQAPGICEHLEVKTYGKKEVNHGLHVIGKKSDVCLPTSYSFIGNNF